MKSKKGLLLIITLIVLLLFFIALGILYFQLRTQGLTFSTGNVLIKINYNNSEEDIKTKKNDSNISIIEETNKTNNTLHFTEGEVFYENLSSNNN